MGLRHSIPSILILTLATAALDTRADEEGGRGFSIQGVAGGGQLVRELETDRDLTYGAILGFDIKGPLAFELEYQHAENEVRGTDGDVTLDQDGTLAHLRFDLRHGGVVPFGYAGVGWVRYSGSRDGSDDRLVIPLGAGLELRLRRLMFGVRGEYQWIGSEFSGDDADFWKVVATAGLHFL